MSKNSTTQQGIEMPQPQLIAKPAFTVVGLCLSTKPKSAEIPALWNTFGPRIDEVPHPAEPQVSYGLMGNFSENAVDYTAGISVTDATDLPAGMTRWDVPENTYAVFETTLSTIPQTFDYIFANWLPGSGYQRKDDVYFERYGETFSPDDNPVLFIYIPVTKQA